MVPPWRARAVRRGMRRPPPRPHRCGPRPRPADRSCQWSSVCFCRMSAIKRARIHQKTGFHFANAALRNLCRAQCQRPAMFRCSAAHRAIRVIRNVSTIAKTSAFTAGKSPTRAILLLAAAGFAAQAQVRVTDSLLPQIAADFHTTVGMAAIVVTAYAITHGSTQLVAGPVADRLGKYRTVAIASALAAVLVAVCGVTFSLPQLALARLATGLAAGWVIPISLAYVGDVIPYARRQAVLARYASGYILGQLFGQAAGGVLGDLFGWRAVFFVLAGMFALAAAGLVLELVADPSTGAADEAHETPRGFAADYAAVLSNPFARKILIVAFLEAALAWGTFAYVGADLHARFGLSFTRVGITVASFGLGGLLYAGMVRRFVIWFGPTGLIIG